MPKIVHLHGRVTPPPRKRRGRDHAAILAAYATDTTAHTPTHGMGDQPHMSYNPDQPGREECARRLMPWARARVGAEPFDHTAY